MGRYSPEWLTKMRREPMSLKFINNSIKNRAILEYVVSSCDSNNTLTLNLGKNIVGKIKFDELEYHIDNKDTKAISAVSKVGKYIRFIPTSIEKVDDTYYVECSRKEAQKECYENYISKLMTGDIIDACIIKVMNYGAFCDIGCGIVALLPTNDISVTHTINPQVLLKNIHRLKTVVKSIDENSRIQLSHKELLGSWSEEASKFNEGDIISGTVLSIEEYGVFVKISQNLSALAEITDLDIQCGDLVSVKITSIKPETMKVKLVIIQKISDDIETIQSLNQGFSYYIKEGHINSWNYSTETAKRQIVSNFDYRDNEYDYSTDLNE